MQRAARRLLALAFALSGLAAGARAADLKVEWAPLAVAVDAYQVERRVDDPGESFVPLVRLPGDSTQFLDRGVTAGIRYCYRVRGVRGARTSPPSPPLCSVAVDAAPSVSPEPQAEAPPAPEAAEPPPVDAAAAATPAIVDRDVKALHRPEPRYPAAAIAKHIEGWVKVRFTVTAAGSTRDIEVVAADPPGVFEKVAIEAASQFVYRPKTVGGVPVDRAGVETEISFSVIDRGGNLVNSPR
jgi:TonB family protein